jgi:hypothetical protein
LGEPPQRRVVVAGPVVVEGQRIIQALTSNLQRDKGPL